MDIRVRARVHARRRLASRGYGAVFVQLRDVLYEHDPLRLGIAGAKDEYGSPVSTILPRLEDCSTSEQIRFVLEQEMARHYPKSDFTKTDWAGLSSEFENVWLEFQRGRKLRL